MNTDHDYSLSGPPITLESPRTVEATDCGENLEYDLAFIELERAAAAGIGDQQYGDTLIAAITPDWRLVGQQADALLQRSKDLRVIAWQTRAWTESTELEGYAKGVALVADLLNRHWDGVHPRIEIGDDGQPDPFSRTNALRAFFSQEALGARARAATLLHVRGADLSLRKVAALLDGSVQDEEGVTRQEVCAALAAHRASLDVVGKLLTCMEDLRRTVSHHLDATWAPDMSAVEKPLLAVFSALSDGMAPDTASPPPSPALASASTATTNAPLSSEVRSRDDASLLLEKVCVYLESCEPAHPSSLLIRRAQRLLHMTFYEIIRDMTPEAIPHIDLLTGLGCNA